MSDDQLQRLIRDANAMGLRGIKILGWVPPRAADEGGDGYWIIGPNTGSVSATEVYP